jgi:hypothetical protein
MLTREFADGSETSIHEIALMNALERMYEIMHDSGISLGPLLAEFKKCTTTFLLEYNFLATKYMAVIPYAPRYSVVPKFHYVVHLASQARCCNPRLVWAYGGEDFVGKMSKLAHSVLPGTSCFRVSSALMDKYRIAMHLLFTRK